MRQLVVTTIMSLDGFLAGPGDNVLALPMDPFFDQHNAERLRAADTLLLGRRTFEGFVQFWPAVDGDPRFQPVHWEISRLDNAIDKVVVSDSLTADRTGAWSETTRIVARADAHRAVGELRSGEGGDILVFGSATMWRDLLAAGLVDEIDIVLAPVALGGGIPAFPDGVPTRLRPLQTRASADSDNVLIRYAAQAVS